MKFSVIVPTYQRKRLVVEAINELREQQTHESYEVIVVVDGATDGSAEALQQLDTPFPLRVVAQHNRGRAAALNRGAKDARGDILVFLDDDMAAHPALLAEHARSHDAGADLVLGHIPVHPDYAHGFLGMAVQAWAEERLHRLSKFMWNLPLHDLITGQASVSRRVFDELQGFDEGFNRSGAFGNEDLDFCIRLHRRKYRSVFNPEAISWQKYAVTPRQHLRQWHDAGRTEAMFALKHPEHAIVLVAAHMRPAALPGMLGAPLRRLVLWSLDSGIQNSFVIRLFFFVRELEYARGVRLAEDSQARAPLKVLAYHAIADLAGEPILDQYGVPADSFRSHLDALAKAGYCFITPDEFLSFLNGHIALGRNALLLTFDDCYQDLLTTALPILRERGIPALAFAVSGKIGGYNDWDQAIGAPQLSLLDAGGLRTLSGGGIEIGAHSRSHVPLNTLSRPEQLADEVAGAVNELEACGLPRPRFLAYPHGEYDGRTQLAAQSAGLAAAFTVESGRVPVHQHCYRIPRIEIMRSDTGLRFRWKVAVAGRWCRDSTKSNLRDQHVSIVIPAFNAEATIDATLTSLQSQTFPQWEAIVVDDGSTDTTGAIARQWASEDARISVIRQDNGGESAARNSGLDAARHDWLLFLDADDWLSPDCLELMLEALASDSRFSGVVCGCVRVTPAGTLSLPAVYEPGSMDELFAQFARDCPIAIHNCMLRRSLAIEVGPFDTSLATCADWDFWQRIARTGARFGTVSEVLTSYRMRPGSSSSNAERVLQDGFTVIRRGHSFDARVPNSHPDHRDGLPADELPEALLRHALWPASLRLGQGLDACDLLSFTHHDEAPNLCPMTVAETLFECVPLAAADTHAAWPRLWPMVHGRLQAYLLALEASSGATDLAQRAERRLEQLILESMEFSEPNVLGTSYGVRIDLDQPIGDLTLPGGVAQVVAVVRAAGNKIGSVAVPAEHNTVPAECIGDAIVTDLAWPLTKQHFRLALPDGSPLKSQLHQLLRETNPLKGSMRLINILPSLLRWQFREGVIRKPRLLAGLTRLLLKLNPIRLMWDAYRMPPNERRRHLQGAIGVGTQRLAREEFVVVDSITNSRLG